MSAPTSPPAILSAIEAVMQEVTYIPKGGQYDGGRSGSYTFRKFEDTAAALGLAFRKHKIFVQSRTINSFRDLDKKPYKEGSGYVMWTSVWVEMAYTFTSLEDGSTLTAQAFGEGKDNSDKATAKAMTTAMKAALTQSFMIPTDDPDPDASRPGDDGGDYSQPVGQGRPPQNQRQAPPNQPPAQPEMPQADRRMAAARWFVQAMNQPGINLEQLNTLIGNAKKRGLGGVEVDGVKLAVRFASVGATLGQHPESTSADSAQPNRMADGPEGYDGQTYNGPPEPDHGGY
jgi:hypothetical protein